MSDLLRRLFTPFASTPRRWLWLGAMLLVLLLLGLTGNLR
jgi:hypothetical protein